MLKKEHLDLITNIYLIVAINSVKPSLLSGVNMIELRQLNLVWLIQEINKSFFN